MPNAIQLFQKYIPLLDEVYKLESKTQILDGDTSLVKAGQNANEIIIPKMVLDGMADYKRAGSGGDSYAMGNINISYETVKFNYDRGRKFTVDEMDNEETAGLAFGQLSSSFLREKVIPEVDAFRMASYAAKAGKTKSGSLADGVAVLNELVIAQTVMDEAEVPEENRILYITPGHYNAVHAVDTTKSREVLASFSEIKKMPQSRFYTAINLKDGRADDELLGGYEKAADGRNINFMVIHKGAVLQYPKHSVKRVIHPDYNSESDGYLCFFREYGLADVYENKVDGVYLHHDET